MDEATTATARPVGPSERLLAFDAVRERFGGIGTSLGRRVIGDLPIVPIGDRVFVRERSLDAYIVALDAQARWDRWDPPT